MTSEKRDETLEEAPEEGAPEPAPPEPTPEPAPDEAEAEAVDEEFVEPYEGDPQEMWIEEYEREGRPRRPGKQRAKPRRIGRWIVLAAVVLFLLVWTLVSPQVMTATGTTYLEAEGYSELGSDTGLQDIRVMASLVSTGDTTWGVSLSGDANATVDEAAVFQVTVVKVSEETRSFWFMGTDISVRNVSMYLEDDSLIGWMDEKEERGNMSVAQVHALFPDTGVYDCYVVVKFSVYEVMRIGFLPADKVSMKVWLSGSVVVSERAEIGPTL